MITPLNVVVQLAFHSISRDFFRRLLVNIKWDNHGSLILLLLTLYVFLPTWRQNLICALLPGVSVSGLMFGDGRCAVWVDSDDDVTLAQSKDREYIRHRFVQGDIRLYYSCACTVLFKSMYGTHLDLNLQQLPLSALILFTNILCFSVCRWLGGPSPSTSKRLDPASW